MRHVRKIGVAGIRFAMVVAIGLLIVGATNSADAQSPPPGGAPEPMFRIQNRWHAAEYLNIQRGSLESGPIEPNWWSAQWFLEQVPGTQFTRIRNRWHPDQYINIEHGLTSSPIQEKWWSAMWIIEQVPGANFYRIRNHWHPNLFLNIQNGFIDCSPIQDNWWSAMWILQQ